MSHPGTVEYVDGDTGRVLATSPVETVPHALRFAPTERGAVPVVRVVATTRGSQRTIREYGPEGELLRSTLQLAGAR